MLKFKPFYFPNSKKLEEHWFHRLVYPLYKLLILLFLAGSILYTFSVLPFMLSWVSATMVRGEKLSWCDSHIEKLIADFKETKTQNVFYDNFYIDLGDDQISFLKFLPINDARKYAGNLGLCVYETTDFSERFFSSREDEQKFYRINAISRYIERPSHKFTNELEGVGALFIGYILFAIIPGLFYKYLLYIFFGKNINSLIE